jgi:hypothetical protein
VANTDTKVVGTLVSDLSKIPKEKFEVTHSSRGSFYKIWYQVEMRFEAMITFRLRFDGMHFFSVSNWGIHVNGRCRGDTRRDCARL